MWLVRKLERHADSGDLDINLDDDDDAAHVKRVLKRRIRLEDIEKAGLGMLLEVDEDDGEQVLVWLK
jgi:hypothetical protein